MRCKAVREPRPHELYWGRCELKAGHQEPLHFLDRGFDYVHWSTAEYITNPLADTDMHETLMRIVDSVTDYQPFKPIVVDKLMRYFDTQLRARENTHGND